MSRELVLRNRQRAMRLNLTRLRETTRHLLERELGLAAYALGVHFVSERRMAEVNQQFLRHEGPTDVITFDHGADAAAAVHGELFLCPAVARQQAGRFRATLEKELVRYLIHGVLHLRGFDDRTPAARRVMKREEARLLRRLRRRFR
jgi:probable rRNA maturation factor